MEKRIFGIPNKDYFFDSWPIIILTLIIFFPLGFILLLRKKDLHRRNVFEVGNTSIGVGLTFFLISIIASFMIQYIIVIDNSDILKYFNILKIYGIIVFIFGILSKLKAMHYKKYIHYVVNVEENDVDTISKSVKESPVKVEKTLNELINKNYLSSYKIEEKKLKHVPKDAIIEDYGKYEGTSFHPSVNKIIETNLINSETKPTGSVVQCPNCGANNKISYTSTKCAYCNSDLSAKRKEIIKNRYKKINKKKEIRQLTESEIKLATARPTQYNSKSDISEAIRDIITLVLLILFVLFY